MFNKIKRIKDEKMILVSNIGSASRKYFIYSINKKSKEIKEIFNIQFDQKEFYPTVKLEDALYEFFDIAKTKYNFTVSDIDIIAERVVAVGEYFLENKIIDDRFIDKLEESKKYDLLHTEALIDEIKKIFMIRDVCAKNKIKCKFKLIGISDSEFHNTIKRESFTYGIKSNKKNNFRKYGYHGISMSEVANILSSKYKNIIAIHLGGGGSVTAVKDGKSIYNSFGMTPVSGIVNLTRSGDIDPFIVLDLLKENKKSFRFLSDEDYLFENVKIELYEKSGLFALTGEKDMRDILQGLSVKNKYVKENSRFALSVYINKINECVGSAYAHLASCDALVLTGSILEKSEIFRNMFLPKVSWLNLKEENILILKTEEEKEMARLVLEGKFL